MTNKREIAGAMRSLFLNSRRMYVSLVCILSLLSGLQACQKKTQSPVKEATVYTRIARATELYDGLSYPTRVLSKVNTRISAEIDGVVARVTAKLGAQVKAKQSLMTLSHTDPVYQYTPVHVFSPIMGIVSSIDVNVGSHVIHGQTLISVIDPHQIELILELPVEDLNLVKKGTRGEFRVSENDAPLSVIVQGTSPTIDANTGTARAQLVLVDFKKSQLSPGVQGHTSFKVNVHMGISLPDNAIIYKGTQSYVRIVKEKKVLSSPVQLGKRQRGQTEILQGIHEDDEVVERSSRFVADSETVLIDQGVEKKKE